MPVYYDTDAESFAISPDECQDCGEPLYDTGCDAPGCTARCCMDCGTGCDIETAPDAGRCIEALTGESSDEYDARINAERARWGLSPLPPLAAEAVTTHA